MHKLNLDRQDLYKIIKEVSSDLLDDLDQHEVVRLDIQSNTELWYYTENSYSLSFNQHQLLKWLQQDYLNDWGFIKSIDSLEFYYDQSGEPAAKVEFTANWVDEDDIDVIVSKLGRHSNNWAVLIFYGDELTLVKKGLHEYEAHDLCTELSTDLSDWNITELIRSEGFEKYV